MEPTDKIIRRSIVRPAPHVPPHTVVPPAAEDKALILDPPPSTDPPAPLPLRRSVVRLSGPPIAEASSTRGEAASIYFSSPGDLATLRAIANANTRSSISSIVSEITRQFLLAYASQTPAQRDTRMVQATITVRI